MASPWGEQDQQGRDRAGVGHGECNRTDNSTDPVNEGCQVAISCQSRSLRWPVHIARRCTPMASTASDASGILHPGVRSSSDPMEEDLSPSTATADADKGESF